jgi:tRNA1Val (adenine37-N6)-methyltransferase
MVDRPFVPAPDETLDRLAGTLWVFQLRGGQRYATDDVLTAWEAVGARPDATTMLDMGCGIGSVGLMVLLRLPAHATLTSLEIQDRSVELLRKTVLHNGLDERVVVHHGDLRNARLLPADARFDLIAANPPYWSPSREMPSPHPQRAAARLELNGDVFDYCAGAARWLADRGRFCFCYPVGDPRPEKAVADAGLVLQSRREVVHREGSSPYLALFVCGRAGKRADPPPLVLRDAGGRPTPAFLDIGGTI